MKLTPKQQYVVNVLHDFCAELPDAPVPQNKPNQYPELPSAVIASKVITLKEINAWWHAYCNASINGEGRLVGYPLWLIAKKEFRGPNRGTYLLPFPSAETINTSGWKVKMGKKQKSNATQNHNVSQEVERAYAEIKAEAEAELALV